MLRALATILDNPELEWEHWMTSSNEIAECKFMFKQNSPDQWELFGLTGLDRLHRPAHSWKEWLTAFQDWEAFHLRTVLWEHISQLWLWATLEISFDSSQFHQQHFSEHSFLFLPFLHPSCSTPEGIVHCEFTPHRWIDKDNHAVHLVQARRDLHVQP